MKRPGIVSLLTDFGSADPFVGIMKGVIARINRRIKTIDLTHAIPPQDIHAAGFALACSIPYFPRGTIHLGVVDPGVGGKRRAIAVKIREGYLVGPDNGLFSRVWMKSPPISALELSDPKFWFSSHPSRTFHGRDIFASVAGHLANGTAFEKVGISIPLETLKRLPLSAPRIENDSLEGEIQAVDRFGNLITNIGESTVLGKKLVFLVGEMQIPLISSYLDVPEGSPGAVIGSHGYIEIAVSSGNAQKMLNLKSGDRISAKPVEDKLKPGQGGPAS